MEHYVRMWVTPLFKDQFCKEAHHVWILGIYLPEEQYEPLIAYMEEEARKPGQYPDVWSQLQKRNREPSHRKVLGYDLLDTYWGSIHAYHCEKPLTVAAIQQSVTINPFGLIARFEDALRARPLTKGHNEVWKIKRH